jgi:hypothetical protein
MFVQWNARGEQRFNPGKDFLPDFHGKTCRQLISKVANALAYPLNIVKCQRLQNNFAPGARQKN